MAGKAGGSRRDGDGWFASRSGRPGDRSGMSASSRRLVRALDGDPDEPGGGPDAGKSRRVDPGPLQTGGGLRQAGAGNPQTDPGSKQAAPGSGQAGGGFHQAGLKSAQAGPGDAPTAPGSAPARVNPAQARGKSASVGRKRSPGEADGRGNGLESLRIRRSRPPAGRWGGRGDGGEAGAGVDGMAPGAGGVLAGLSKRNRRRNSSPDSVINVALLRTGLRVGEELRDNLEFALIDDVPDSILAMPFVARR